MNNLQIGQKFYYTGDQANSSDFGEIIEIHERTNYTQVRYLCKFESGKERIVEAMSFNKGIGQRFKTIEQYNEEREKHNNALLEVMRNFRNARNQPV